MGGLDGWVSCKSLHPAHPDSDKGFGTQRERWKIKGRERYIFLGQGCERVCGIGFGWVAWTGGYPVNPYILPILILTRGLARNVRDGLNPIDNIALLIHFLFLRIIPIRKKEIT